MNGHLPRQRKTEPGLRATQPHLELTFGVRFFCATSRVGPPIHCAANTNGMLAVVEPLDFGNVHPFNRVTMHAPSPG